MHICMSRHINQHEINAVVAGFAVGSSSTVPCVGHQDVLWRTRNCSKEEERGPLGSAPAGRWQPGDVCIANTLRHFSYEGANVSLLTVRPGRP